MKIIKIEPQGKFKYPDNATGGFEKKTLVRLDYYKIVIKTRCGHHRIDIRESVNPRIFRMIRDKKLKVGQNLISLMEEHMPRDL